MDHPSKSSITNAGDNAITEECELFERLVDATPISRQKMLAQLRKESPELCLRLENLLTFHNAAESKTKTGPRSPSTQRFHHRPGDVIDGYEIIRFLASGGEADVYLALQTKPIQRTVAIKILRQRSGKSAEYLARFEAEKTALANLTHPGISKLFDAGVTPDGQYYCTVEYVPGPTMTQYSAQQNLSLNARLKLFIEICSAIQYANETGVFHRDLKPSNVIVTEVDGQPQPVVIDFGIAKIDTLRDEANHTITRQGDILGTLGYIAPERIEDARISNSQTEVYSLGAMLYELICQKPIVEVDSTRGIFAAIEKLKSNSIVKPSDRLKQQEVKKNASSSSNRSKRSHSLASQIVNELDWICLKAVDKDLDQRYASVRELRKDVCRSLDGLPVEAAPPRLWYQLKKFYQRHKWVCILSGLLLAMLFVCVIGSTYWAFKLDAARRTADQLAAKSQNDSLHVWTVIEFMTTAFDNEDESFAAVAVCGEQLLSSPALEQSSRQDLQYTPETARLDSQTTRSSTEELQSDNPLAPNYVNRTLPEALLDKQRIRFYELYMQKQINQFGQTSPFVVQTLLSKAESEIELKRPSSLQTLQQALTVIEELGWNETEPIVQIYFALAAQANELLKQ